jgi:hypothetical protein
LNGLTRLVLRYGLTFLFLNVFLEQIGVPIPAVPTLVVAGALVADGKLPGAAALAAALVIVGVALALYVAFKWAQRRRFYKTLRMARIPVDDLYRLMQEGRNPLVVDVRTAHGRSLDPRRIPGAAVLDLENLDAQIAGLPAGREIVLYCT